MLTLEEKKLKIIGLNISLEKFKKKQRKRKQQIKLKEGRRGEIIQIRKEETNKIENQHTIEKIKQKPKVDSLQTVMKLTNLAQG